MFDGQSKESGTTNLLHMLEDRVTSLVEQGKIKEARQTAKAAVNRARSLHDDGKNGVIELALSLEVQGDLLRQTGELEEGREVYEEALGFLEKAADTDEQQGRISASLAVLNDMDESPDDAKRYYEKAIAHFRLLDPPALLDIADLNNNLAFFYDEEGDLDKAETLLLEALKISHEELGARHEQTGVLCNNVGGLYYKIGHFEQALEMHLMALDARQHTFGEQNAETAQSYANLALVYVATDEKALAREYFEKALGVYEGLISESARDYATVVANYTEFLKDQGELKEAANLDRRANKALKRA